MSEETKPVQYLAARYIEILCISLFVFGFLWNGTEVMNLTTPQFFMLYGGSGAVICEVLARLFSKKKTIEVQGETKNGSR
jgi:cellobiose-specific phosphotransferase system component IIC